MVVRPSSTKDGRPQFFRSISKKNFTWRTGPASSRASTAILSVSSPVLPRMASRAMSAIACAASSWAAPTSRKFHFLFVHKEAGAVAEIEIK